MQLMIVAVLAFAGAAVGRKGVALIEEAESGNDEVLSRSERVEVRFESRGSAKTWRDLMLADVRRRID